MSSSIYKVELIDIEFFAYHGLYEEERKVGNKYTVDVLIELEKAFEAEEVMLNETINYENIYNAVFEVMTVSELLLETIAQKIIKKLKNEFAEYSKIVVSVCKYNPPIGGICNKSRVTLENTKKV